MEIHKKMHRNQINGIVRNVKMKQNFKNNNQKPSVKKHGPKISLKNVNFVNLST